MFWKTNNFKKLVLVLILLLGGFFRFYRLGHYPPLNADEAAIGYDAWSVLKTGRDEHGSFLPLHFKSFGDYKPGGYFYVVLPFVALFGLNQWAVRLPSALAAVITIWLVYRLIRLIWKEEGFALASAFVLSLSPWHLHFSRGGWESNFALFLITLAVYLFYQFKVNGRKVLIYSALAFALALYTYHSARLIVPLLLLALAFFNRRFLWRKRKELVFPLILGVVLLIPLAFSFLKGGASSRFSGVGLFADTGPVWRVNELLNQHQGKGFPFVRLIHNRFVIYGISFFQNYFSHFDGRFLFIEGDEVPRSKLPDIGPLYLIEAPLLLLGVWFWLREKRRERYLPFLLLLTAPVASAMTFQAPSALRSLPMTVPLAVFIGFGIRSLFNFKPKKLVFVFLSLAYLWSLLSWSDQYFDHYLKRYPSAWPDFKGVADWIKENGSKYDRICIAGDYDQPYILALFYLQYPPEKIQKEIRLTPPDQFGFSTVESFGRYQFGSCQGFNGKILE